MRRILNPNILVPCVLLLAPGCMHAASGHDRPAIIKTIRSYEQSCAADDTEALSSWVSSNRPPTHPDCEGRVEGLEARAKERITYVAVIQDERVVDSGSGFAFSPLWMRDRHSVDAANAALRDFRRALFELDAQVLYTFMPSTLNKVTYADFEAMLHEHAAQANALYALISVVPNPAFHQDGTTYTFDLNTCFLSFAYVDNRWQLTRLTVPFELPALISGSLPDGE